MIAPDRPETPKGRVLVIAGSDSGGGAGIQADIKAVMANRGYAMTAVTAITVQNTTGVFDVHPIPVATVIAQMKAVASDIGVDAVKTGMLGSRALIESVADCLDEELRAVPRIIDPVMVATSGDVLLPREGVEVVRSVLVPGAALVTPNVPEAALLTGRNVEDVNGQRRAAERLLEAGARAALVKGGHISGRTIIDVLQTEYDERFFESPRIESTSTHGTGCTLASSIAAQVALGTSLAEAVERARDYLHRAIETAPGLGNGHGPVNHGWPLFIDE